MIRHAVLNALPDAVLAFDADYRLLEANRAAQPFLACPWAEALGQTASALLPEALTHALTHLSAPSELALTLAGTLRHYELSRWPLPEGAGSLVIMRDITARKELENQAGLAERQRLRAVIESSRDGVVLIDLQRRVQLVNAIALEFLQLPGPPAQWINRPLREALRPLHANAPHAVRVIVAEIRRLHRGDEPATEADMVIPPRTLHWINLPIQDSTRLHGRLLILRDATQERQLAVLRDELTYMMVHDLRSPLSTVVTALDYLNSAAWPTDEQQTLTIARESVLFSLDLVNAILDVNQLENGQVRLDHQPIALAHLVENVVRLYTPQANAQAVRLAVVLADPLPLLLADPRLLERVLQNLLNNALKFTPANGTIRITATAEAQTLTVSVSDTGPGVAPDILGRLFQKFVTGRSPNDGYQRRGSGLGLAFCKLVIEAHGGRIWANSPPGQGATLCFTLPVAEP